MADSNTSLTDLGVNVYDQNELEADIMKQLDEVAAQQASEQQYKFAEKELRSIQRNIRQTKTEENALSRQINNLLMKPLSDVVLTLKELKRLREEKRLKLEQFEKREKQLTESLSTGNFNELRPFQMNQLFDTTSSSNNNDQLIRTGLMTPFGTTTTSSPLTSSSATSSKRHSTAGPSLADFDWLGKSEANENKSKGKGPAKIKKQSAAIKEMSSSSSASSLTELENQSRLLATKNDKTDTYTTTSDKTDTYTTTSDKTDTRNGSEDDTMQSDSSCYETDEELGQPLERRKKRKLEYGGEEETIRGNKKRKGGEGRDDGDDKVYKNRIKYLTTDEGASVDVEQNFKVPSCIWQKLYRYQQTGVRWLWELHCQQAGGIMGDEMGLGKTIQMIAFLSGLRISNVRSHVTRELGLGPVLIVCPATVLQQWVKEFHIWYPPFRVAILHDTGSYGGSKSSLLKRIVSANGVIITTYASIRLHHELLMRHQWEYVVLDEGHKIRNPDAEITLACKQFATPHRIILSGSPMQNNLRELWSLFDFVYPGKLGTLPVFMEQFSVPITIGGYASASQIQVETAYRCACVLRDTINPYLLRRLKSDVKIQLPNKNEQVLFCRLTDYQRELYEEYIKGPEVEAMMNGGKQIFAGLITLRKLCNHPDLVTKNSSNKVCLPQGEEETDEESEEFATKKFKIDEGERGEEEDESFGFWRQSGKMIVVEALLKIWKKENHKVLFFSQSKQMLNILQKFLIAHNYTFLRMDGGTSVGARQTLIKEFNENPSIFVFLLTTRVGGLGVNLTGADRVIIYDPDWNPSTDTQARERAWRIGQKKPVTIYRLLTSGTIEEKVYHRQIFKQFLTNRVLRDPRQRRFFKSNDLYELFTLGSSEGPHKTETSAIIAGTGSEIKLTSNKKMKRKRTASTSGGQSITKRLKPATSLPTAPLNISTSTSVNTSPDNTSTSNVTSLTMSIDKTAANTSCTAITPSNTCISVNTSIDQHNSSSSLMEGEKSLTIDQMDLLMSPSSSSSLTVRQKKKKKKRKRGKQKELQIEGHRISGLENMDTFNPGSEDEENTTSNRQDDLILRKLFKKSGVESAVKHDTLIDGGNPDSVIVESEANKIAQSAARALRESFKQCHQISSHQWGQPTWTGQYGSVGAPRFGEPSKDVKVSKTSHFLGQSSGDSEKGSLTLSSNVLLQKMRTRNALTQSNDEEGVAHLHSSDNKTLLRELRAFIAHQAKRPGKATTDEILTKFGSRLVPADSAIFRSMLHEICDFQRYHGDGLWTLKSDYR